MFLTRGGVVFFQDPIRVGVYIAPFRRGTFFDPLSGRGGIMSRSVSGIMSRSFHELFRVLEESNILPRNEKYFAVLYLQKTTFSYIQAWEIFIFGNDFGADGQPETTEQKSYLCV